ncbi:MAG: hypothetical protein P4M01_14420 [Acidobacteriota bacterium]|nr:hypothetical protein [Acidobacteriota bacterium]
MNEEEQKKAEATPEEKPSVETCAERLTSAAEALERVIGKMEAQYEALNQKIDRIIAAVEKPEKKEEVSAAAGRRTVAPLVGRLLAKGGLDDGAALGGDVLEKALRGLTIEQRMVVKAELARAGVV